MALRRFGLLAALALTAAAPPGGSAPSFRVALLGGGTVSDRELRGRLVILNFWATWCAPCKRELADLDAFVARHGTDRVAVIAIDAESRAEPRLLARQAAAMRIPIALAVAEGAETYHPIRSAVPTTFVIDPGGRLVLAQGGALAPEDLGRLAAFVPAIPAARTAR